MSREFPETVFFRECFKRGLRDRPSRNRNVPGLLTCKNAKPLRTLGPGGEPLFEGLVKPEEITDPFNSTISWPFPQIFRGKGYMILADQTSIYSVNEDGYGLSQMSMNDVAASQYTITTPIGSFWHFIDHGESWMLLNGQCVVYRGRFDLASGTFDTRLYKNVKPAAGCAIEGRTILGGFSPGMTWSGDWLEAWEVMAVDFKGGLPTVIDHLPTNFIIWTSIGGSFHWLFNADIGISGVLPYTAGGTNTGYSDSRPLIKDMLARNEMGWMPMTFAGDIWMIKRLGDGAMVYGEQGISYVFPATAGGFPTLGKRKVSEVGIINPGAVAGDERSHVFILNSGDAIRIWVGDSGKIGTTRLGYAEFFKEWSGEAFLGSYDPIEEDAYFGIDGLCFVVSNAGMYESHLVPTSLIRNVDGLVGPVVDNGESEVLLETDEFDLNIRGYKTIRAVEVGASDYTGMYVSLLWKTGMSGGYRQSDWVKVNPSGFATPIVTAEDFKLLILCKEGFVDIDWAKIQWKLADHRNTRGIYAQTH